MNISVSPFQERLLAHARTLITLAVLILGMIIAVSWGLNAASRPFPSLISNSDKSCVEHPITPGESVTPDTVTVSVLNGGTRAGLAGTTIDKLTTAGFARGQLGNAPDGAKVNTVEIWTTDQRNPAVRLVSTYLGKRVVIKNADAGAPGVDVIVGDKFTGVVKGRDSLISHTNSSICGP